MSLVGKSAEFYSSYDPRHVPGCILWLDGADPQTLTTTLSGSTILVTQWTDKSSNAYAFTRRTAANNNSPVYRTLSATGYSAPYFGSSSGLENSNILIPSNYSAFAVVTREQSNGSYAAAFKVNNKADNYGYCGVTNYNYFASFVGNPWLDVLSNTTRRRIGPQPVLLGVDVCGTLFPYWNGEAMSTKGGAVTDISGLMIGATFNNGDPWLGQIGEILIFSNRLTPEYRQEIEGYLMWKWKLNRTEPITGWATGTANPLTFTPTSIGGLAAWLDASDTSTITTATMSGETLVANWTDKSGAARPTIWRTSNPRYDPVTRSIVLTGGSFLISGCDTRKTTTSDFNVFMVYKYLEGGASSEVRSAVLWGADQGGGNNRWCLLGFPANAELSFAVNRGGTVPTYAPTTYQDSRKQVLFSSRHSLNQADGMFVRINGYQVTPSGFTEVAASPQTAMQSMSIGNLDEGNSYPARIAINEIIVYRTALTDASRANVETYLATKWNIPWYTPVIDGHPYSNTPIVQRPVYPTDVCGAEFWFDAADVSSIVASGTSLTTWSNKGTRTGCNIGVAAGTPTTGARLQNGLNVVAFPTGSDRGVFNGLFPEQTRTRFLAQRPTVATNTGERPGFFYQGLASTSGNDYLAYVTSGIAEYAQGVAARVATNAVPDQSGTFTILSVMNASTTGSNYIAFDGSSLPLATTTAAASYNTADVSTFINAGPATYTGAFDLGEFLSYNRQLQVSEYRRIEGYLAWKWGRNTSLPTTHPFRNFYPLIGQFSPTLLSNCYLWLDAMDSNAMEFAPGTSNVLVWKNKAPAGTDIGTPLGYNATPVSTCTLSNGAIGGLPGIRFGGLNYFTGTTTISNAAGLTGYVVFTSDASTSTLHRYLMTAGSAVGGGGVSDGSGATLGMLANTTNRIVTLRGTSLAQELRTATSFTAPTPTIGCMVHSTTNARIFVNGASESDGSSSATLGPFNTSSYIIGALPFLFCNAHVGFIGEALMYSRALTTWERQRVEGYLAGKWGLQPSLPVSHPYSKISP